MPEAQFKIEEALLDPKWETHIVQFDGAWFISLTINHPRTGPVHAILPKSSASQLRDWLIANLT